MTVALGTVLAEQTIQGAMSGRAHLAIALVTLAGLIFVVRMVRHYNLRSKYSMLWLAISLVIVVFGTFPDLLTKVSKLVGIYYPPAVFLSLAVGVLFVVAVHYSWELSRAEERTRILAEESALLRARIEALEALQGLPGDGQSPTDD